MSSKERPDARGLAALILGASLLGFAAMLVRWASPAGPLAVGFYRMAIALPFVAWMARGQGRPGTGRSSVAGNDTHVSASERPVARRRVHERHRPDRRRPERSRSTSNGRRSCLTQQRALPPQR